MDTIINRWHPTVTATAAHQGPAVQDGLVPGPCADSTKSDGRR